MTNFSLCDYQEDLCQLIIKKDGDVVYYPEYFENNILENLKNSINWEQDVIKMYGKEHPIPRLNAWYADKDVQYQYSGIKLKHNLWNPLLKKIKKEIEKVTGKEFNSVLINFYRDGNDYVSWHSDDEKELGPDPIIASVSFGATRKFNIKHKYEKEDPTTSIFLDGGSLLVMKNGVQNNYVHQISKTKKFVGERISLTFRKII